MREPSLVGKVFRRVVGDPLYVVRVLREKKEIDHGLYECEVIEPEEQRASCTILVTYLTPGIWKELRSGFGGV